MMRLGAILWLGFAVAVGIGLFHVKYDVQALEGELTKLRRQIVVNQQATHVLEAEWSYLNEPGRLAELSRRHLDLAPVSATQMASFGDLPELAPRPLGLPAPDAAGAPQLAPKPPAVPILPHGGATKQASLPAAPLGAALEPAAGAPLAIFGGVRAAR